MLNINEERMSDAFIKYHVEGLPFGAVFHSINADYGDFHDHPWGFWSTVLNGGYVETVLDKATGRVFDITRRTNDTFFNTMDHVHRIGRADEDTWTIIRPQPQHGTQTSGFWRQDDQGGLWHRFWHDEEFRKVT